MTVLQEQSGGLGEADKVTAAERLASIEKRYKELQPANLLKAILPNPALEKCLPDRHAKVFRVNADVCCGVCSVVADARWLVRGRESD